MDISIVFATFKNEHILEKSLQAYCDIATDYQWELIVVDNANRQETRDVINLYKNKLPLTFIEKSEPGKNNALNKALSLINSDLVLLTDNDTLPDKQLVDVCVSSANKYPEYAVFSGKILPDVSLPQWIDITSHRIRSALGFYDKGEVDREIFPEDVWGGNMLVRNGIFNSGIRFNVDVGPNGKNYIMGSETEFLKRLQTDGYKAMYLANSKVLHQIRSEQLSIEWLKNRAYRSGRGSSFNNEDDSVILFGIPRYLLRKLISNLLTLLFSIISGNKKAKCLAYMEFNFNFGKSKQAYNDKK
jgi:glycosyltransferase involved in cell wall biosynthesis